MKMSQMLHISPNDRYLETFIDDTTEDCDNNINTSNEIQLEIDELKSLAGIR